MTQPSTAPAPRSHRRPQMVLPSDGGRRFVREQLAGADSTAAACACSCRTRPAAARCRCCSPRCTERCTAGSSRLTVLVALGTHAAMSEAALAAHLGYSPGRPTARYPRRRSSSTSGGSRRRSPTSGRSPLTGSPSSPAGCCTSARGTHQSRRRRARRHADRRTGLPAEVVGFSGGNKYLFPGVSGRELIDLSHWLGALITSADIIGTRGVTPVRAMIDEAAAMVPGRRLALCVVTRPGPGTLHSMAFGDPQEAWAAAADVSAETHIRYLTPRSNASCR